MAKIVAEHHIPVNNICKLSDQHTWALDFYNRKPLMISSIANLRNKEGDAWVYVTDDQLQELRNLGFDWDKQYTVDQFRITRLQLKFLDPVSRKKVLRKMHLIHVY